MVSSGKGYILVPSTIGSTCNTDAVTTLLGALRIDTNPTKQTANTYNGSLGSSTANLYSLKTLSRASLLQLLDATTWPDPVISDRTRTPCKISLRSEEHTSELQSHSF